MSKPKRAQNKKKVVNKDVKSSAPVQVPTGKSFHLEFLNPAQKLAYSAFDKHDVLFLLGPAGCGKALTLDSQLFGRTGPFEMKDVKIGDEVANPDGGYSRVTGVYPQGKKLVHRVHFSDETFVDCCEEHLWSVSHSDRGWKNRVVNTKFLINECRRKIDGKRVLSIECTKPVEFDECKFDIPPYLMGVMISEGNTTNTNVAFANCETEVVTRISEDLYSDYIIKNNGIDRRIVNKKRSGRPNFYKESLKDLEFWGKYSYEKEIPKEYLYGSVAQRIALLQGMMDGDGETAKNGSFGYCTTSLKLAKDFCQLIFSLGGTTRIKPKKGSLKKDGSRYRTSYRCRINIPNNISAFFLDRKKIRVKPRTKYPPKRYVDRVEILNMQEMQCISVDHNRSLYLTDNYIVTHNTHLASAFGISEILAKKKKKIIMTRPIVEAGEKLGFLPGDFAAKVDPYMMPLYDCVDRCLGGSVSQKELISKSTEVAPLAYLRGRTFHDSICILDEAQNCTRMQLKLFMTRFGKNSKIIITGDPAQSDLAGPCALLDVVKRLEGLTGVGIITFDNSSIVRHPLIGAILDRLE